jgi:hypothetical protein
MIVMPLWRSPVRLRKPAADRDPIVAILPRTAKMGGITGGGNCVGFVSSRKRNLFDQLVAGARITAAADLRGPT